VGDDALLVPGYRACTRSMAQERVERSVSCGIARQASPMVVSLWYVHSYAWPWLSWLIRRLCANITRYRCLG
jgi:hypothetical protein